MKSLLRLRLPPRRHLCSIPLSSSEGFAEDDAEYQTLLRDTAVYAQGKGQGHKVLVVQPKVKWGRGRDTGLTTHERMLAEAVALVETLPGWRVGDTLTMNVTGQGGSQTVFGSGNMEELRMKLHSGAFSAAFLNLPVLTGAQQAAILNEWQVPVFDRYNLVLQIFRAYARTTEARLQVALAEVPYIRARLKTLHEFHLDGGVVAEGYSSSLDRAGGSGAETFWQQRRFLLKRRYTNAGKTSLCRLLTQDLSCEPRDRLFATLDVTGHPTKLRNGLKVILGDTVGFISRLPTTLVHSFHATIDHVRAADLILHVRDLSHPDTRAQKAQVLDTLGEMDVPESQREAMVEVGNKADLLSGHEDAEELGLAQDCVKVSCVAQTGLEELQAVLERRVMDATGCTQRYFRLQSGSAEFLWLSSRELILDLVPDPSGQGDRLFVSTLLSPALTAQFLAAFPRLRPRRRQ